MRKIFRTAVSLAMGCALLSTSAFAANSAEFVNEKLNVNIDSASGDEQVAIVVVNGSAQELAINNDSDIVYIDQNAAKGGAVTRNEINVGDAKEVSVFAGYASNNTGKAVYIGGAKAVTTGVELRVDKAEATTGEEVLLSVTPTGDAEKAQVTFAGTGAKYVVQDTTTTNYKFKATVPGSFTLKAMVEVESVKYYSTEITFTVTKAEIKKVSGTQTEILAPETVGAENNYGFGAAMTLNVPTGVKAEKMIWVLDAKIGEDTVKKFTKAVAIGEYTGDVKVAATFVAGRKNDADKLVSEVTGVNALILDTNGVEYCTDSTFNFSEYKAN